VSARSAQQPRMLFSMKQFWRSLSMIYPAISRRRSELFVLSFVRHNETDRSLLYLSGQDQSVKADKDT
jgi:hypothetical protein